jgi:hypothetical protein
LKNPTMSQIRLTSQCLKVESQFWTWRSIRKLLKMTENCTEERIGLEEPGTVWRDMAVRDDKTALKYLYRRWKSLFWTSQKVGSFPWEARKVASRDTRESGIFSDSIGPIPKRGRHRYNPSQD